MEFCVTREVGKLINVKEVNDFWLRDPDVHKTYQTDIQIDLKHNA